MAKAQMPTQKSEYPYPSRFGTHKSMVVREDGDTVVCADEHGEYVTPKNRVDNGLADPSRYAESRIQKLFQGRAKSE